VKYCFNCGTKIIPHSKFCIECGIAIYLTHEKEVFVENSEDDANLDVRNTEIQQIDVEANYTNEIPSKDIQEDQSGVENYSDKAKSSIWIFIRSIFVLLSYVFFYFATFSSIGQLFFPYYINSDSGLYAAILLALGVLIRYLTLKEHSIAERFKIIAKNISFVIFLYAFQVYTLSFGVLIILISAAIALYLDINTPNGFFNEIINGRRPPKYFVKIAIFAFLVSMSINAGRFSYFQNEGLKYNYNIKNNSEIQDSQGNQDVKVTVIDKRNEGDSFNVYEELERWKKEDRAYFGDSEKTKITIMSVQEKLKELGFYSGEIDGINGPLTKKAIIEYKRNTYTYNEHWTIDEYANEYISISMLRELEIPFP
jgi:hypothetical protein